MIPGSGLRPPPPLFLRYSSKNVLTYSRRLHVGYVGYTSVTCQLHGSRPSGTRCRGRLGSVGRGLPTRFFAAASGGEGRSVGQLRVGNEGPPRPWVGRSGTLIELCNAHPPCKGGLTPLSYTAVTIIKERDKVAAAQRPPSGHPDSTSMRAGLRASCVRECSLTHSFL